VKTYGLLANYVYGKIEIDGVFSLVYTRNGGALFYFGRLFNYSIIKYRGISSATTTYGLSGAIGLFHGLFVENGSETDVTLDIGGAIFIYVYHDTSSYNGETFMFSLSRTQEFDGTANFDGVYALNYYRLTTGGYPTSTPALDNTQLCGPNASICLNNTYSGLSLGYQINANILYGVSQVSRFRPYFFGTNNLMVMKSDSSIGIFDNSLDADGTCARDPKMTAYMSRSSLANWYCDNFCDYTLNVVINTTKYAATSTNSDFAVSFNNDYGQPSDTAFRTKSALSSYVDRIDAALVGATWVSEIEMQIVI
jgi:hypothetical protein